MRNVPAFIGFMRDRLVRFGATMLGATLLVYLLMNVAPGHGSANIAGAALHDAPYAGISGYFVWLSELATLDLGESSGPHSVAQRILYRFLITLRLTFIALAFCLLMSIPMAMASAVFLKGSLTIRLSQNAIYLVSSTPVFVLGYLALRHIAPTAPQKPWWVAPMALAVGNGILIDFVRSLRAEVERVFEQEFVRTAVAQGISMVGVVWRHILVAYTAVIAARIRALLGGAVVIEMIFFVRYKGIGQLAVDAAMNDDVPMVMGITVLSVATVQIIALLADMVRASLDPRIAQGESRV